MNENDSNSVRVIKPPAGLSLPDFREIWNYRDLLWLLVWRDISARYRQSVVGIGWAIIRPVFTTIIFTVVFGRVLQVDSGAAPYALFCICGIIPWSYFSTALSSSTGSLVGGRNLLTKVHFPRIILPISSIVVALIDILIQLFLLVPMLLYFQVMPKWTILTLPLFILMAMLSSFTVGIWLTCLNVKYRDVGQVVPFLISSWMWITPVVYVSSVIPTKYWPIYALNPMVSVIDGFRWAVYGGTFPDLTMMSISLAIISILLFSGLIYFRKMESTFADVI